MNRLIPQREFDEEVRLVRYLTREFPWRRSDGKDDRALRAEYRRWTTADTEPTPLMLAPLWRRIPTDGWKGLNEPAIDRAVHHAALVLHLLALGEGGSGKPVDDLGAASKAASLAEGRFTRLVNTPQSARLETLARLFRRFGRAGVNYRAAAPHRNEDDDGDGFDRRSTRNSLRDSRRDDLAALLAFLFTDDPKASASRWAAGYYRLTPSDLTTETA